MPLPGAQDPDSRIPRVGWCYTEVMKYIGLTVVIALMLALGAYFGSLYLLKPQSPVGPNLDTASLPTPTVTPIPEVVIDSDLTVLDRDLIEVDTLEAEFERELKAF